MRKTGLKIIIPLLVIILLIITDDLSAQRTKSSLKAGEQRSAEKGLKDNRYYFYFINSSITNFGNDNEKKLFKEAIQRDIIARLLYMKFLFHESYREIRRSQNILISLYKKTILKDIRITRELLNEFASSVLKSKDAKARRYLRLGYRDAEVSRQFMIMADNYRKNLYSLRLNKYVRAIKKAKLSKRYAFLSIMRIKQIEKKSGKELSSMNFKELGRLITDYYPERKDYFLTIHYDNYYLTGKKKSFYDKIWEKPDFNEIKEYNEYLKKN